MSEELMKNIPIKKDKEGNLYFKANEIENILNEKDFEINRLNNIINEAIEYIEKHSSGIITENDGIVYVVPSGNILQILKDEKKTI